MTFFMRDHADKDWLRSEREGLIALIILGAVLVAMLLSGLIQS